MPTLRTPATVGMIGAGVCALATFAFFFLLTALDNTQIGVAIGTALIVSIVGAIVGFGIGLAIGLSRAGVLGGAMIGLVATGVSLILFAMLFGGGDGFFDMIRKNWRIISFVLAPPAVITGVLTAWLGRR